MRDQYGPHKRPQAVPWTPDPDHPRTCWRHDSENRWKAKQSYASERDALRDGIIGLYPFQCGTCGRWHMSSRPPKPGEDDSPWSHDERVLTFGEAAEKLGVYTDP